MTTELIKRLLEVGAHFGHQTRRWNPKMAGFIFGERKNIHIIDLEKTQECIANASEFLRRLAAQGKYILFVGAKKQAQDIVAQEAKRCGMPYVNRRWLGGLLTNFQTIQRSVKRFKELKRMEESGIFQTLSKKEVSQLNKEKDRLYKNLEGVLEMDNLPAAVFVVDPKKEATAVRETKRLSIPTVALIDTNCDPTPIQHPIPGNDDAVKSIRLITSIIADSIFEGRKIYLEGRAEEEAIKEKEIKDVGAVAIPKEYLTEEGEIKKTHFKDKTQVPRSKMKTERGVGQRKRR